MDWERLESEHASGVCRAFITVSGGPEGQKTKTKVTLCGKRSFEEMMFFIREQSSSKTSQISRWLPAGIMNANSDGTEWGEAPQKSGIRACMRMWVIGEHSSTTPVSLIKESLSDPITAEPDTLTALSTGLLLHSCWSRNNDQPHEQHTALHMQKHA